MTVGAVDTKSTSEARTDLVRYQQQLAADLAAKAADRVLATDRAAATRTERVVRQDERGGGTAVDITV
jgi:hypothetical protein